MRKSEKTKSKKIERLRKGAENLQKFQIISIYHNTLHKYAFSLCINIQKLAYCFTIIFVKHFIELVSE